MTYLYGHRGAKGELPENSLSGFLFLRTLAIHRVELDAQLSADNEIVIFHDTRLKRTTHQSGAVHTKTVDELKAMNVAAHCPNWRYTEPVPTLLEVLEAWPELSSLQLDTKRVPRTRVAAFVERLQEVFQQFPLQALIVTSEYHDILRQVKQALPQISTGLITTLTTRRPLQQAQSLGCNYLIANYRQCNEKFLAAAHFAGLKVSAWTVNVFQIYQQLAHANIHSIITDYPTQAITWQQLTQ